MTVPKSIDVRMENPLHYCLKPEPLPQQSGYEIAGLMRAKVEPAGDFYDFMELPNQRQAFVIGDAVLSPHFISRGLFAAAAQACVRKLINGVNDQAEVMSLFNKLMHSQLEENSFCMCSLLLLDSETRQVVHVGAGHQVYLLNAQGDCQSRLESTGLPLGLFPDAQYEMTEPVELAAGDMLLMLTDGFQETISPDHRLFGMEQVFQAVREMHKYPVNEILDHLAGKAEEFRGELSQRDDMTAIMIRVTG